MCNQVQGFHCGVRKFIAKIQMSFPNCAEYSNLCLHSYLSPSQTEFKVIGHYNTYVRPKLKVIEHFLRQFFDRHLKDCILSSSLFVLPNNLYVSAVYNCHISRNNNRIIQFFRTLAILA